MNKYTSISRKLRRSMTPGEAALWQKLRNKQIGVRVRRQHPIQPFIVDFYIHPAHLIIEIDGSSHDKSDRIEYDIKRQNFLESEGFSVIRFSESDARFKPDIVVEQIQDVVESVLIEK